MSKRYDIGTFLNHYEEDRIFFVNKKVELFKKILGECESPLEQQMLIWLSKFFMADPVSHGGGDYFKGLVVDLSDYKYPISIRHQKKINISQKSYRADFLALVYEHDGSPGGNLYNPILKIVVEVDGHNYHNLTKHQVRRDRERDRFMQRKGYQILRFTGAEVYEDPEACAGQVLQHICETVDRLKDRENSR